MLFSIVFKFFFFHKFLDKFFLKQLVYFEKISYYLYFLIKSFLSIL